MHTYSLEAQDSAIRNQFDSIMANTDFQVVGSMARAAILDSYNQDTSFSFRRPNGSFRDIDVMDHDGSPTAALDSYAGEPLEIDTYSNNWIRLEANGLWLTYPGDQTTAEEVNQEIFVPVTRTLGTFTFRTYSAATQRELNRMVYERPKDRNDLQRFDAFVDTLTDNPSMLAEDRPLPAQMYEPFARFRNAVRENHPGYFFYCRTREFAKSVLPTSLLPKVKRASTSIRRQYIG